MNVTSAELITLARRLAKEYAPGTLAAQEIDKYHAAVEKEETEFISMRSSISPLRDTELSSPTDMSKVGAMKAGQFYNYEAMRAIGQKVAGVLLGTSTDPAIYSSPQAYARAIAHQVHMRERTDGMHRIGAESIYGYAISGPIDGVEGLYVVKTPRRIRGQVQDLTHEQYVGYRLNSLRLGTSEVPGIPGFALVFGGARCPEPEINDAGEVLSFCSPTPGKTNKVSYLIYENVFPSDSMRDYIVTASIAEFLSDFLQTCHTLEIAKEQVGFTHWDLHADNILRRKVKDTSYFSLKFRAQGKDVYIACTAVATIIDYGRSRVLSPDGKPMSALEPWMATGFMTREANTLGDAYKLLMSLAGKLLSNQREAPRNPTVYREMEKIFRFFNQTETLAEAHMRQDDLYYAFPSENVLPVVRLGIYDLIAHIVQVCPTVNIYGSLPQAGVLRCGGAAQFSVCNSFMGTMKEIQAEGVRLVTFFEFYDFATHALALDRSRYNEAFHLYDYSNGSRLFVEKIENLKSRLVNAMLKISQAETVNLNGAEPKDLANKLLIEALSVSLDQLITGISLFEDISLYLKVAEVIANVYDGQYMLKYITDTRVFLTNSTDVLDRQIEAMRSHYAVFRQMILGGRWEIYAQRFPWYHTMLTQIAYLIHRMRTNKAQLYVKLPVLPTPVPIRVPAPKIVTPIPVYSPSPRLTSLSSQSPRPTLVSLSAQPPKSVSESTPVVVPAPRIVGTPKVTAVRDTSGKIRDIVLL